MFAARRALLCALLVAAMVGNSIAEDDDDGASALQDLEHEDAKIARKEEHVEHALQDDLSRAVGSPVKHEQSAQSDSPTCACLMCANDGHE